MLKDYGIFIFHLGISKPTNKKLWLGKADYSCINSPNNQWLSCNKSLITCFAATPSPTKTETTTPQKMRGGGGGLLLGGITNTLIPCVMSSHTQKEIQCKC